MEMNGRFEQGFKSNQKSLASLGGWHPAVPTELAATNSAGTGRGEGRQLIMGGPPGRRKEYGYWLKLW